MKNFFLIFAVLIGVTIVSNASTRSDVKVLEASENIKYITQKIAVDYLFYYTHQNKKNILKKISKRAIDLKENIKTIAISTKKPEIKLILDYIAYENEELKSILAKVPTRENAGAVLDFSEAATEGAIKIAKTIHYKFSDEEKMLMKSKKIEYLIEKIQKYYIVLGSKLDKENIAKKMKLSIKALDSNLKQIDLYTYPIEINSKKADLNQLWSISKGYLEKAGTINLPNILLITTDRFETIMDKITLYHSEGK